MSCWSHRGSGAGNSPNGKHFRKRRICSPSRMYWHTMTRKSHCIWRVTPRPMVSGLCYHQMENGTGQPAAFASRSLSPAERKYVQLNKEALSIIFGVINDCISTSTEETLQSFQITSHCSIFWERLEAFPPWDQHRSKVGHWHSVLTIITPLATSLEQHMPMPMASVTYRFQTNHQKSSYMKRRWCCSRRLTAPHCELPRSESGWAEILSCLEYVTTSGKVGVPQTKQPCSHTRHAHPS